MQPSNYIGKVFGRWTVVERAENSPDGSTRWVCLCVCGTRRTLSRRVLHNGHSRSCGCLKAEVTIRRNTKHGHSRRDRESPTYFTWANMRARCARPTHPRYHDYGGRGIKVCDRWLHSFASFLADMGERPDGKTIERIDNDGNYEPANCRWATRKEQNLNTRNNRLVTIGGETRSLVEWAELRGLLVGTVYDRLYRGWSIERAINTPLARRGVPRRSC